MDLRERKDPLYPIDFNPNYSVTETGLIYSHITNKYLKPSIVSQYQQVILITPTGERKGYKVHRLIAHVFHPNPENKGTVNHKDGNKLNNHKDNLEWMTQRENLTHSYDLLGITPIKHQPKASKPTTIETKLKMSQAKQGESHPKFKGYYTYNGITSTSINNLAKHLGKYPVQVHRMVAKGLVQFSPKR